VNAIHFLGTIRKSILLYTKKIKQFSPT